MKKATAKLRANLVMAFMKLVTPKLAIQVDDSLNYAARVPRPFTVFLKKYYGSKPLIGVEIGFGYGFNAKNLLNELNIKRLYCVDPFVMKCYFEGNRFVSRV